MDEPGTVFFLVPENKYATEIVRDAANHDRRYVDPDIASVPFLRIRLDQQPKTPPHLVRFGRHERNDVILNNRFSRNDQCYFDFNKETGELLLHDISENGDTKLYKKNEPDQLWKTPRQCVVVLTRDPYRDPDDDRDREWIFKIRPAKFRLIPRRTQGQGEAAFTEERLAFAGQPDSERTYEGTMQRLITLGLQSDALTTTYNALSMTTYNPHNTRFSTRHQPEENQVIRYTKLGKLGSGGQGEVHKVVDMYTGDHHACKIVGIKTEIPQWGIHSERDFRARVEREVDLVQQVKHPHIVPYIFTQGWKFGQNIEIFMPLYEGSLEKKISDFKSRSQEERQTTTTRMFHQISLALDYVHTGDPPIIHRDVKPPNILCGGENFYLADFGIAKVVDSSRTLIGTDAYIAPELRVRGDQTTKVDIYALGATIIECLDGFPDQAERPATWQLWHQDLQRRAGQHGIASMLAPVADERPTAHQILRKFFCNSLHPSVQTLQNNIAPSSSVSSPIPSLVNGTGVIHSPVPTLMEWTRTGSTGLFQKMSQSTPRKDNMEVLRSAPVAPQPTPPRKIPSKRRRQSDVTHTKSIKFVNKGRKKTQKPNVSSQNERRARSQSAGIPKQTSSSRKRRSRLKSVLAKMPEMRILGMI